MVSTLAVDRRLAPQQERALTCRCWFGWQRLQSIAACLFGLVEYATSHQYLGALRMEPCHFSIR
jgi:hypothetical protein